jgi:hypothetical protein
MEPTMKLALRSLLLPTVLGLIAALSPGSASATFTALFTVPPNTFIAGNNTFDFSVRVVTDGTGEFVDNIQFAFPVGINVVSGTGTAPNSFCAANSGLFSKTNNVVLWYTLGHPSGCGGYTNGQFDFSVTVSVPVGYAGPMEVLISVLGDGYPAPLTDFQTSTSTMFYKAKFQCLDADGNGHLDALTDGLIILRALFGLTGASVSNNAVGSGASHTTWADIRAHLNTDCGTAFAP